MCVGISSIVKVCSASPPMVPIEFVSPEASKKVSLIYSHVPNPNKIAGSTSIAEI